jgi:hypothetical protein
LEKFADPVTGFLHIYDKTAQRWRRQKPEKVMCINNYYRQNHAPLGIDPYIFEKGLGGNIEPNATIALKKLLSRPPNFTVEDTAAMIMYLAIQYLRVPRQAEMAKEMLMKFLLLSAPSEILEAMMRKRISITVRDEFRFDFIRISIDTYSRYLDRMELEVIEAEKGCYFLTTDSPVSLFNSALLPPLEAALHLVGTLVFFPLDSQHLLLLRHPESREPHHNPVERVPEPQCEDGEITVHYGRVLTENQVNDHNGLMLELAHHIVVARNTEILRSALGCP